VHADYLYSPAKLPARAVRQLLCIPSRYEIHVKTGLSRSTCSMTMSNAIAAAILLYKDPRHIIQFDAEIKTNLSFAFWLASLSLSMIKDTSDMDHIQCPSTIRTEIHISSPLYLQFINTIHEAFRDRLLSSTRRAMGGYSDCDHTITIDRSWRKRLDSSISQKRAK
jgi:hypothetical protein